MNYTCFTVSYCCIAHHVGNYYVNIINGHIYRLFRQTNEFARNIVHTNITYLKASADVKISTFLEKNGGDEAVCGSQNGPLRKEKMCLGNEFGMTSGL